MLANTTISILRGTVIGTYGDDLDSDETVATQIPASILARPTIGGRPVSGRTDTPRTHTMRVWSTTADIRQDDRVRDERTGEVYSVVTAARVTNNVGLGSSRFDLQRVT